MVNLDDLLEEYVKVRQDGVVEGQETKLATFRINGVNRVAYSQHLVIESGRSTILGMLTSSDDIEEMVKCWKQASELPAYVYDGDMRRIG